MIPLLDMRVNMLCNGGSNDGILTFYVGDPGLIPRQCMPLAARHFTFWASLVAQMVKNLPVMKENWVQSLGGKILWRKEWLPTLVFSPGKSHGQKSLVGYSAWGHKELHMNKQLTHIFFNSFNTSLY